MISVRRSRRRKNSQPQRYRPRWRGCERLEDRRLLAITVDTLVDGIGVPGMTLREAVLIASAGETIDFSVAGTLNLTSLGEIHVDKSLTIQGPGANVLTINAFDPTPTTKNGDGSRVFNIDDGDPTTLLDVELMGLTLTGGDSSGSGGGIFARENLTIAESLIFGNHTATTVFATGGGGIYSSNGTTLPNSLTVIDSTIRGNSSGNEGGGIRMQSGSLVIERSTISGNTTTTVGGGISAVYHEIDVQIRDSTISSNVAGSGGGIFLYATSPATTITDSTISGNTAAVDGGGIDAWNGFLAVRHSTITLNQADSDANTTGQGGGILLYHDITLALDHTIVANNQTGGLDNDIDSNPTQTESANYSLVEVVSGVTFNGLGNITGLDPLLGPLADNGGPTMTHALLAGSPAIDAGDAVAVAGVGTVPLFDQRTDPYSRVAGGRIDIGAFELRRTSVVNTLVDETDGNFGTGDLSLREALTVTDPDGTITFAVTGPIHLTNLGELVINRNVTIDGPGANLLTITAFDPTPAQNNGDGSRLFSMDDGDPATLLDVVLSGLTLTGGDSNGSGGAIFSRENLTIANSVITDNHTETIAFATGGGGIFSNNGAAVPNSLTVIDSTISDNSSSNEGGGIRKQTGSLVIERSTMSGNTASNVGGGISAADGGIDVQIRDSTIRGNVAGRGGGIFLYATSPLTTITGSTISGNTATGNGGGIELWNSVLAVRHSTIALNHADSDINATGQGGGISLFSYSTLELDHTIVANNQTGGSDNDIDAMGAHSESANYSLTEVVNSVTLNGSGNITGLDPLLGPLTDNGGPTLTHALLVGSPAINMGDPAFIPPPNFDQRGAPFVRVAGGRIDIGAFELQSSTVDGDFNDDGLYNGLDIDALVAVIAAATHDPSFDLTGDTLVNLADRDAWLAEAGGINLGAGRVYRIGDANLDSVVDGSDFNVWNSNKFTTIAQWTRGDFNADGAVDGSDFNVWNSNKFTSSDAAERASKDDTPFAICLRRWNRPVRSTSR